MSFSTIVYIIAIVLYVIYRYQQAKKKEQETRKTISMEGGEKQTVISTAPTASGQKQRTMTDIFREVEMNMKPYGQATKPMAQQKNIRKQAAVKPQPKKEFQPVSTKNYSTELTSDKGTAYALEQDVIKQGEVSNYNYNFDLPADRVMVNFELRKAIMANVILQRPEW